MNIVLDTNAVLYFLAGRLCEPLPCARYYLSVITEIELLSYPLLRSEDKAEIINFLADVTVVDLTPAIKQATIDLRRQHRLKLPDAMIAATALCLNATLLSNDLKLVNLTCVSVKTLALKD